MSDAATPRTTLAAHATLHVICRTCQRERQADLAALIEAGHGGTPLPALRWRCQACGSADCRIVVSGRHW